MTGTESQSDAAERWDEFNQLPSLAQIEFDRFCPECSYNLAGQQVRRDPRTGLLLCRCPECGRFESAQEATTVSRAWTLRLAKLLLWAWVLGMIAAHLLMMLMHGVMLGGEASIRAHYHLLETTTQQPSHVGMSPPGMSIGNQQWIFGVVPVTNWPEFIADRALEGVLAFVIGYLWTLAVQASQPHWRRKWYAVFAVAWVIPPAAVAWLAWTDGFSRLPGWMLFAVILPGSGLTILGGLLAAAQGRKAARLMVRVIVPPRWRGPMGYLWLADGLALPEGFVKDRPQAARVMRGQ